MVKPLLVRGFLVLRVMAELEDAPGSKSDAQAPAGSSPADPTYLWESGDLTDCKSVHGGSIPPRYSKFELCPCGGIGRHTSLRN